MKMVYQDKILVRGARVSGSGKSSLALGVLYSEGASFPSFSECKDGTNNAILPVLI